MLVISQNHYLEFIQEVHVTYLVAQNAAYVEGHKHCDWASAYPPVVCE